MKLTSIQTMAVQVAALAGDESLSQLLTGYLLNTPEINGDNNMKLTSIQTMAVQVAALAGDESLSQFEQGFAESMAAKVAAKKSATDVIMLSEKQVDCIENIWRKHYA